jgi:hypothetical protein
MTLPELKSWLDGLGVKLSLRLRVDAPAGVITPEVKAELERHKPSLLARLGKEAEWEHLSVQRWGPALNDPIPEADVADSYAVEERLAIQDEEVEYF